MIERTHDMNLVREIMTHPKIYKHLVPDKFIEATEFSPVDSPYFYYLLIKWDDKPAGLILLTPLNASLYQGHIALLPEYAGLGYPAIKEAFIWLRKNTNIRKLLAFVAVDNKAAKTLLDKTGFYDVAILKDSLIRNAKLTDQYLMGYDLWVV